MIIKLRCVPVINKLRWRPGESRKSLSTGLAQRRQSSIGDPHNSCKGASESVGNRPPCQSCFKSEDCLTRRYEGTTSRQARLPGDSRYSNTFRTTTRATPASSKQSTRRTHQRVNSRKHLSFTCVIRSCFPRSVLSWCHTVIVTNPRMRPSYRRTINPHIHTHNQSSQPRRTAAAPQPTITTHNHHPNQRHHEADVLKSDDPHSPNGIRTYDIDFSDGSVISGTGSLSSVTCALCLSTPLSSPEFLPPFLNFPTPRFGKCHPILPPLSLFHAGDFTGAIIEGTSLTF